MGVIEDGTVRGVLPKMEGFAVHYPAYPSSTSRAVETLGGMDEIVRRRSSKDRYLELRFRPEDPYCHPTFGDLRTGCGLLLKVSKGKAGSPVREESAPSAKELQSSNQLCADVVARIRQAYHFEGMADYQYVLPVHAAKLRKKKRDHQLGIESDRLLDLEEDEVMALVPPLFSPKDIPEQIVLKSAPGLVLKQLQRGIVEQRWEMEVEPCLAIPFNSEKIPGKVDWEAHIPEGSVEWQLQSAVSQLFQERPIWPRRSLHERLLADGHQATSYHMRRLLARVGYYFATGPYGRFWVRKGYDPRKDPESKIYQRVDFRVPTPLRKIFLSGVKKRSEPSWKDLCSFQALPTKIFTSFQFFELEDEYIRQEMEKPTQKRTCTHSNGWLSKHVHEILDLHVRVKFLSIFEDKIVERLLRNTRKQLEKCKRMLIMGDVQTDEEEFDNHKCRDKEKSSNVQHVYREGGESELDCEMEHGGAVKAGNLHPIRNDEEEFGIHEVEDEVEEDEPDEYGMPSMGDNHPGFPLNPCSYKIGENLSGDYLQDILSGFQNKGSMGNVHETDVSDEEYEIYEQESEEDFSE